jgi:hypothetical protein
VGCHFCGDELIAIFMVLGGVKYIPTWIKGVWARRHKACQNPNHEHGGQS